MRVNAFSQLLFTAAKEVNMISFCLLFDTWITTHLPIPEGWMAELAMLADR